MESLLAQKKGLCSIEIVADGVAVAYATSTTTPDVTICEFHSYEDQNSRELDYDQLKKCLSGLVTKHKLQKSHCNWVLHPNYYRLALITTPNVPLAEYKEAVRWQIKDLINYPLEDVVVDLFYPDEKEKTPEKIYVIAAQNSFLQKIVDVIQDCELYPIAVDIREFAMRNLLANLHVPNETIGLLSVTNESCLIMLVKQHNIQFVRRIPINSKHLKADNYNHLVTELQRSFNYCQTTLQQEIPTKFFMLPTVDFDQDIAQHIATSLSKEISHFVLQKMVNFRTPINQQLEYACLAAVGGALRGIV